MGFTIVSKYYYFTLTIRSDPSYGSLARNPGCTYERKSGEFNRQGRIDVHLTIATGVRTVFHRRFTIGITTLNICLCVYVSMIRQLNPNPVGYILTTYTTYVHTVASRILAFFVLLLRLLSPGNSGR